MKKGLIIVESPAKIKTLKKFLGGGWEFASSLGHVRDLPPKEFGIDIDAGFLPTYANLPEKKETIAQLQRAAKGCQVVYLCPDPDREGEAIAWHISQILPKDIPYKRVTFNAITKEAVRKALESPREIDLHMVNAQQTRRLLDRIVGYKISPILNRRMQRGREGSVSAGRVQSVALKLVVDREKEIELFKPVEYWNIAALLYPSEKNEQPPPVIRAQLYSVDGKRVDKEPQEGKELFLVSNKEIAEAVVKRLQQGSFTVDKVERKEKKRHPVPPFITSTLQQEASRHHGFTPAQTMSLAQALYEGIDLGDGPEGLITYMRTDSVRLSPEALSGAQEMILAHYGKEFLPDQPKQYSTKASAQDAHEAIRPTNPSYHPDHLKHKLSAPQHKLYTLIWRRFIASQMNPALYDTLSANISSGNDIILRATGSVLKFKGYLAAYEEKVDDEEKREDGGLLPPLEEGQKLNLDKVTADQAFTKPPPRYSEASLIKDLEKSGIGRPSTYVPIMNKIQGREYTTKEGGRLVPTELGKVICQFLEDHFQLIMNVGFTANMEDDLELIAENKKEWQQILSAFWQAFAPTLEQAEKEAFVPKIITDLDCPKCHAKLQKIWFKGKYFLGCSNYPDCNYSAPLEQMTFRKEDYAEDFDWEQNCPKCSSTMTLRHGRYGSFLGCTNYPKCKGIVNIPKKGETPLPNEEMPKCPALGCPGELKPRRSRFGKVFYSCSTYPECDVIVNSLDQLESKYANHQRTPYAAKTVKQGKKKEKAVDEDEKKRQKKSDNKPKVERQQPLLPLSPSLQKLIGEKQLSRGQVMKKVWEYIKIHHLQSEENKRMIKPDALLAELFGSKDPVDMFKMTSLINHHIGVKDD